MESSIRTSKQKAVKKVIANAYDNMAVEEFGMPEKSQDVQTEGKDMEKLCPETTFTRNVRPLCGKNALIVVLALIILVLVTVNILLLTRGNLQHKSTSTFQTNNGETDGIIKSSIRTDCSKPCLNGATCHEFFTCDCMPGYEGDFCEIEEPQSYLVMLGGEYPNYQSYSECDVYELSGERSDAFTVAPIPGNRKWAAVVDTEDSIYINGGRNTGGVLVTMYKLSKSNMMWTEVSRMQYGRAKHSAVEVNNTIIIVGTHNVEIYDVATNIWRVLGEDSHYPIGGIGLHALCVWRGAVYSSGGENSASGTQAGVYRLVLETESWTWFADLVHARKQHSMVVVDDQLYVLDGTNTEQLEMYDECAGRFTVIANSPLSIWNTNAVVLGSNIITAGGYLNDKMAVFDTVTRNFTIRDVDLRREYWQSHVATITI